MASCASSVSSDHIQQRTHAYKQAYETSRRDDKQALLVVRQTTYRQGGSRTVELNRLHHGHGIDLVAAAKADLLQGVGCLAVQAKGRSAAKRRQEKRRGKLHR
jgi:hypothetical protein